MHQINKNPSRHDLRTFGLSMLVGFVALAVIFWIWGRRPETGWGWAGSGRQFAAVVFVILGPALGLGSLSPIARHLYVAWMTVAGYVGLVVTTVILSVLFVVLLAPFALIRLSDPLRRKLGGAESYWEEHDPHEPTLERMARQF